MNAKLCLCRLLQTGAGQGSSALSTGCQSPNVGSNEDCFGFAPDSRREFDGAGTGKLTQSAPNRGEAGPASMIVFGGAAAWLTRMQVLL